MFRFVAITNLTALAIAVTPVVISPAKADSDFDKFLAGAVTVAIIGGIVAHNNRKQRRQRAVTPNDFDHDRHRHQRLRHTHGHRGTHVHHGSHNNHAAVLKTVQVRRNHKPKQCLRKRWTRDGWVTYYVKKCLRNHHSVRTIYHYR